MSAASILAVKTASVMETVFRSARSKTMFASPETCPMSAISEMAPSDQLNSLSAPLSAAGSRTRSSVPFCGKVPCIATVADSSPASVAKNIRPSVISIAGKLSSPAPSDCPASFSSP